MVEGKRNRRIAGDEIDEEKGRNELEKEYICISRDLLITASSVFRRLSFRLSPLHPLDRAVCSVASLPSFSLSVFLFSLSLSLTPTILRLNSLPSRRTPLRLIDFLRPDSVRGCDPNGCSFSRLIPRSSLRLHRSLAISSTIVTTVISNFLPSSFERKPQRRR